MKCKLIGFQDFRCKGPGTHTVIQEQAQGGGGRGEVQWPKGKSSSHWACNWSRSICLAALMMWPQPTGHCSREAPPPRSGCREAPPPRSGLGRKAGLRLGVLRWETGQDEPTWRWPGSRMAPPHPRSKLWTYLMTSRRLLNLADSDAPSINWRGLSPLYKVVARDN